MQPAHCCWRQGSNWNEVWSSKLGNEPIVTPPYDLDGDTTTFSPDERVAILEVWRMVSEDYALWDVDVTTEPLTIAQLEKCVYACLMTTMHAAAAFAARAATRWRPCL